jgi:hypothetical protein
MTNTEANKRCEHGFAAFRVFLLNIMQEKPSFSRKLDKLGVSQEDLLREQQQLFARAREAVCTRLSCYRPFRD